MDLQDQDIVVVDNAEGDKEGPNQIGFNRVRRIARGVNGDDDVGVDNTTDETDAFRGEVIVDKATANTLKSRLTTIFLPIVYIMVFAVGLPANTISLYALLIRIKEVYLARIYMVNLSLSNIIFAIWIPLKIAYHFNGNDWIYGEGLCKVFVGFFYGNMYCSILFITGLSVHRCHTISSPFSDKKRDSKVAIGVCVSIWVFILTTTIPLYQYDHTVRIRDLNITTCHDVSGISDLKDPFTSVMYPYYYFMIMFTIVFLIPCIVIVVAFIHYWNLKKCMIHNVTTAAGKKRDKNVVVMLIVVVTFLVCFIPSNIMLVIHYYLLSIWGVNYGYDFYITSLCLASLNICLDPVLYYGMSDYFKSHTKNILLCRSTRTADKMAYLAKCSSVRRKE